MSIQNIATSSTLNFNLNGVKTHVFGLQGAPFQATPYLMDFRNLTVEEFRFTPRGAYIDNTKSANAVTLQMQPIGMQITVPAGALWAIHWPAPKQSWLMVSSNSVGTDITNIWFVDYPIMPYKTDSTVSIAGPIAVTQSGAWNVGVNNFPASQVVSGSVSISNFPATQAVSGSVSVSNFPATQPVSGSVSVSNFPPTQPISGSVSVSNFPATQPISGTVAATQGTSPWVISGTVTANAGTGNFGVNLTQINGSTISLGQKTKVNSFPIVIASDQDVLQVLDVSRGKQLADLLLTSSSLSQSFGTSATKYISYFSLSIESFALSSGTITLTLEDGNGNVLYQKMFSSTSSLTIYNFQQAIGVALLCSNGVGTPKAVLTGNTSAMTGSLEIFIAYA